jgi:hypothetical protein
MLDLIELNKRFDRVFDKKQAKVLAEVIVGAYGDLVKAGDFNELKAIVKDLAESQKELADAQKRTELRVEELAEAQKRTEKELRELVGEHRKTRTQLGGLSMTIGYTLEDKAFKALPALLKKDYGLIVKEKLKRKFVTGNKGQPVEVNIIGQADQNGQTSVIVGEAKSQLAKNDVDAFISKKLNRLKGIYDRMFPILITYMISEPDVEEYAKGKGIVLYYSYDLES